jgi:hypothetical protein
MSPASRTAGKWAAVIAAFLLGSWAIFLFVQWVGLVDLDPAVEVRPGEERCVSRTIAEVENPPPFVHWDPSSVEKPDFLSFSSESVKAEGLGYYKDMEILVCVSADDGAPEGTYKVAAEYSWGYSSHTLNLKVKVRR